MVEKQSLGLDSLLMDLNPMLRRDDLCPTDLLLLDIILLVGFS